MMVRRDIHGEWVSYDAHRAAVKLLEEERDELLRLIDKLDAAKQCERAVIQAVVDTAPDWRDAYAKDTRVVCAQSTTAQAMNALFAKLPSASGAKETT